LSNRNRPWHEELNELLTEETSSHLSRARESLSKHRKRREARERRRQVKEQMRADLHREELDRDLAKLAVSELERKYSGLGILPLAAVMALAALTVIGIVIFNPDYAPLLVMAFGLGMGAAGMLSSHSKAHRMLGQLRAITDEDEDLSPVEAVRSLRRLRPSRTHSPIGWRRRVIGWSRR
jgi:Flp pilus assembly protein TadB